MLNETYRAMLGNKSVIRETFMYGKQRAAEIGYENVFDYSLGNPSVPCPQEFTAAMQDLLTSGGHTNYFVGTVEAAPSLDDVIAAVKAGEYKKVVLEPLMGVAGEIGYAHLQSYEGNATYRNRIIDAIANMDAETLEREANYELY